MMGVGPKKTEGEQPDLFLLSVANSAYRSPHKIRDLNPDDQDLDYGSFFFSVLSSLQCATS